MQMYYLFSHLPPQIWYEIRTYVHQVLNCITEIQKTEIKTRHWFWHLATIIGISISSQLVCL